MKIKYFTQLATHRSSLPTSSLPTHHSSLTSSRSLLHTPYFLLFLLLTSPAQPFTDLSPREFHAQMQQHPAAIILDTRMIEKYERNRIPGARPAPYTEALKALTDTLDKSRRLLVYCGHDDRSTHVCRMLTREMGFENVFRLQGGLIRWEKENLPLDTTAVRTGLE